MKTKKSNFFQKSCIFGFKNRVRLIHAFDLYTSIYGKDFLEDIPPDPPPQQKVPSVLSQKILSQFKALWRLEQSAIEHGN